MINYFKFLVWIWFQILVILLIVIDQVRLWELERDRFKFMEGVLYDQFLLQNDFELLRDYVKVYNYWVNL